MTYDRQQEVVGWHRHELGGTAAYVESVATIPHPDGDSDQVWLVVRRTVNGVTKRYVEFLEKTWEQGDVIADAFFVDSGSTYSGAPAATITGLWHLIAESVRALGDGVSLGGFTVSATGTITLPASYSKVQVGLEFAAELETMRLEAGSADGTAQGKTKRITNVVLRLEDTGKGVAYGPDGSNYDSYVIADGVLFTGDTDPLAWPSGHEQEGRLNLAHSQPTPCSIIAIFPQVTTED